MHEFISSWMFATINSPSSKLRLHQFMQIHANSTNSQWISTLELSSHCKFDQSWQADIYSHWSKLPLIFNELYKNKSTFLKFSLELAILLQKNS